MLPTDARITSLLEPENRSPLPWWMLWVLSIGFCLCIVGAVSRITDLQNQADVAEAALVDCQNGVEEKP